NASRPCSSSNVPSGSPTWACLVTFPLDRGNMRSSFRVPLASRLLRALRGRLALALLPLLLLALPVVRPPDLVAVSSSHPVTPPRVRGRWPARRFACTPRR